MAQFVEDLAQAANNLPQLSCKRTLEAGVSDAQGQGSFLDGSIDQGWQ